MEVGYHNTLNYPQFPSPRELALCLDTENITFTDIFLQETFNEVNTQPHRT